MAKVPKVPKVSIPSLQDFLSSSAFVWFEPVFAALRLRDPFQRLFRPLFLLRGPFPVLFPLNTHRSPISRCQPFQPLLVTRLQFL